MASTFQSLKPSQVSLITNETCNFKCRTCYAWTAPKRKYISLDEIKILLSDLSEWLGDFKLELAGGEILLRKDIGDILRFAKSLGIHISICSNGSLIDRKNAEILVETCDVVNLSLNSLEPSLHDYMRGFPGSHARLMTAIDLLQIVRKERDANTYFNIMCILCDHNKADVIPLLKWSLEKKIEGFSVQAVSFPYWRPVYDPTWKQKGKLWPKTQSDLNSIVSVIDELILFKKETGGLGNNLHQLAEMRKYFVDGGVACPPEKIAAPPAEDNYYIEKLAAPEIDVTPTEEADAAPAHRYQENKLITENHAAVELEANDSDQRCRISYHNLNIDFDGFVRICHTMRPIGNIREDHIKNIWFGGRAAGRRQEIKTCEKGCKVLLCNSKENQDPLENKFSERDPNTFSFSRRAGWKIRSPIDFSEAKH